MNYTPGPYTQAQLKAAIDAAEIALTNRYLKDGAVTDAEEKRYWREAVEKASFGRNTVMYDDQGYPSVMVAFPMLTEKDLLTTGRNYAAPAYLINDKNIPMLYISKYQNIVQGTGANARALSLKGVDPKTAINHDDAITACRQKGTGWHCMTNAEWAAVALLCKVRGFQPRGNNSYGKDHSVTSEAGVPSHTYDSSGTKYIGRVATGSGPVAWTHDGTPFGIYDLNGNIYEWTPGLRLNGGEIQIIENNNAADNAKDLSATSDLWRAMLQDGTLVHTKWVTGTNYALNTYISVGGKVYKVTTAGVAGAIEPTWPDNVDETVEDGAVVWTCVADATLKYDVENTNDPPTGIQINTVFTDKTSGDEYLSKSFQTVAAASGVTVPDVIKLLALAPIDTNHGGDGIYIRNHGERCAFRGGSWYNTSIAGVFYLVLNYTRTSTYNSLGFRSAFASL